jgi:hypothetical protein
MKMHTINVTRSGAKQRDLQLKAWTYYKNKFAVVMYMKKYIQKLTALKIFPTSSKNLNVSP